jgi:hypothetical protein
MMTDTAPLRYEQMKNPMLTLLIEGAMAEFVGNFRQSYPESAWLRCA